MTTWELDLTGWPRAINADGDPIVATLDRATAERLFTRVADQWHHEHHYRWWHPLPVLRRLACRRCEHDIWMSADLDTLTLTIYLTEDGDAA